MEFHKTFTEYKYGHVEVTYIIAALWSAKLMALLRVMFSLCLITFPIGVLGQVWYIWVIIKKWRNSERQNHKKILSKISFFFKHFY